MSCSVLSIVLIAPVPFFKDDVFVFIGAKNTVKNFRLLSHGPLAG